MSEIRCSVTELITSQCAHCRPTPEPDPFDEPSDRGPWFHASYRGECAECGDEFEAGDLIRADGNGGYVADCCDQAP